MAGLNPLDILPPELRSDLQMRGDLKETTLPPSFTGEYTDDLIAVLGSTIVAQTWDGGECTDTSAGSPWSASPGDNTLYLTAMLIREPCIVTGFAAFGITAGVYTADQSNQFGLYQMDPDEVNFVQVAVTTSDGNLWKTANVFTKNAAAPVTVESGLYFAAILHNRSAVTTAPRLLARASVVSLANPLITGVPARAMQNPTINAMASSYAISAFSQIAAPWWVALY